MHRLLIALSAAAAVASAAAAAEVRQGALAVANPWSLPAAAGMTGAGYMAITNSGRAADTLTAVETPVAARVAMHKMSMTGGVMRMDPAGRIAIPAGATTRFAPGGLHLMLLGLKRPLRAGESFPATLVFAQAGRVKVAFDVTAAPPAAPGGHDHTGH